jgi:hypothetical protein
VIGNLARDVVDGGSPTPGGGPRFAADAFRRPGCGGQIVTRFHGEDEALFRPVLAVSGTTVTVLGAATTSDRPRPGRAFDGRHQRRIHDCVDRGCVEFALTCLPIASPSASLMATVLG